MAKDKQKKVVKVLVKEIAKIDEKMKKLLISRADLKASIELFDDSIRIDDMSIITGKMPSAPGRKKAVVPVVAKGKDADKVVRRGRKPSARMAVAGSILFGERIESEDSGRLLLKTFMQHLVKTGYVVVSGNFYMATSIGTKYARSYANTGIKFYTDTFDELLKECGFKFTRKKELV